MQKWVSSSGSSVLPLCSHPSLARCKSPRKVLPSCWVLMVLPWQRRNNWRTKRQSLREWVLWSHFFPKPFFLQASIWNFVFPSRFSYSKFQSSGIKKLEKLEHLVKAATWLHECKPTSPVFVRGSQFSGLFWASIANHNCVIAKVPTAHRLVFACLSVGLWSLHVYSKEYDLAVATYKEAVETLRPTPQDAMDGII